MLKTIKVYNPKRDMLELPFDNTGDYLIKGISGLGPPKVDILTTEYVNVPGGVYQGNKENQRNIVMLLGLNPSFATDDPFGSLRRGLYSWFLSGAYVEIYFESTNFETVMIKGYVDDMIPSMFTDTPEVQVSILCPDLYFYSLNTITASRNDQGTITMINPGQVTVGLTAVINGFMTVQTGERWMISRFDSEPPTHIGQLVIPTTPTPDSMIYVGDALYSFSAMKIETTPGQKSAQFMPWYEYNDINADGSRPYTGDKLGWTNVLGYLLGWIYVNPGTNVFRVTYNGTDYYTDQPTLYLSFTPRYKGL